MLIMKKKLGKLILSLALVSPLILTPLAMAEEEEGSTYIPTPARPSDLIRDLQEREDELDEDADETTTESDSESDEDPDEDDDGDDSADSDEEADDEEEDEEDGEVDFLTDTLRVYTVYDFATDDDADYFIEQLEDDSHSENQIEYERDESVETVIRYRFNYSEDATEDKRPLFVYIDKELDSEEAAQAFIDQQINLFPDILSQGEPVEIGDGKYHQAIVIRPEADAQKVFYNPVLQLVEYNGERGPYSYVVEDGEEDEIQSTLEEIYPDMYEFTEEEVAAGVRVTMTPVDPQELQAGNLGQTEDSEITGWRRTIEDFVAPYGIGYQHVIVGAAIILAVIGLLFIVLK